VCFDENFCDSRNSTAVASLADCGHSVWRYALPELPTNGKLDEVNPRKETWCSAIAAE
jgi:hypothetical protein